MTKLSESLMASIEKEIEQIKDDVEIEWEMGGLSYGLYGDYASEVAKRVLSTAITRAEEEVRREVEEKYRKQFEADKLIV